MRFGRSTNFEKKISTKIERITLLFYINRLWFRVPHGLSGAFIRHYTSRPLVLPYLRSLRPHKWLHLASTSTYWVSNGILFQKLFWPTVRKNCLPKGQIISKGLLVSTNSPKKWTNKFVFTTTTNLFVRFLGEFEDTKKSLRNFLTFKN